MGSYSVAFWDGVFQTQHKSFRTDPSSCLCEQFIATQHFWCGGAIARLGPHLLKAVWAVSRLALLPIKRLCTFMCRLSCEYYFSFLWDKCPRLQLLNYMVSAWWVFKETAKPFPRAAAPLSLPASEHSHLFLCVLPTMCCWHWYLFEPCQACSSISRF